MPQVAPLLGQIALNLAIGVGGSMLANAMRPQRATQAITASRGLKFDLTLGEEVPVSAIWGRGRTAGQLTFAQEYGEDNRYIKLKIDMGYGTYDALQRVTADEKVLLLTGSNADVHGAVVEDYRDSDGNPRMWMKFYHGLPGQTADEGLMFAAPTRWGVNHTATRRPYAVITLDYHADLFPNSALPRFGFDWKGLRLYDWRKDSTMPGGFGAHRWDDQSTWEWTENPAVIAWNWRRGYWINGVKVMGMGFSRYANDLAYFTAAANISEEELFFAETGRTLNRYAFGREIEDSEEHLAVLRELEASWCGSSFDRGGAYAPVPAASQIPVLTLEDRHRLDGEPVNADRWGTVSSKKTNIHGSYASLTDLFVPTPYGSRINLDLQALTRGPKAMKFDQLYEHTPERAQMRAEIALRRNLFGAVRTETFGPVANVLEAGDAITRNCSWGPTLMIVDGVEPTSDGLGRIVTMTAWSNTIVPDPAEGFVELPPTPGTAPVVASRTLQVQGLNVTAYQRVTGGNEEPYARAVWTQIEDPNCDQVMIRVWPNGEMEADAAEDFFADARLQSAKIFGPLKPLTTYRRKALVTRKDGRQTYWTTEGLFTTGDFVAGAVAPGTVGIQQLYGTVLAGVNSILTSGPMSIASQIQELRDDFEELAAKTQDLSTIYDRRTTTLVAEVNSAKAAITEDRLVLVTDKEAAALRLDITEARFNNSIAGVSQLVTGVASDLAAEAQFRLALGAQVNADIAAINTTYNAIVGPGGSLTSMVTNLSASFNGFTAGGAVGFQAAVSPDGVTVRYQVVLTIAGQPVAVDYLDAVPDDLGGWKGRKVIIGDELWFLNADGSYATAPFYVQAGYVYARNLVIDTITSQDLTSIVIDGIGGNFTVAS